MKELIDKYTWLSKQADTHLLARQTELKEARKNKDDDDSGIKESVEYQEAKEAVLSQKRVCQIYGQFCHDLGDAP